MSVHSLDAIVSWFELATQEQLFYIKKADEHFGRHARPGVAPPVGDFVIRGEFSEDRGEAREALARLVRLSASAFEVPSGPAEADNRSSRELIRLKMYVNLGLWLSHYCIGWPQLLLWEEIVALAVRLKAYPGEAFFHKLVGDAYRAERVRVFVQRSKRLLYDGDHHRNGPKGANNLDGLLVLAFAPIVLLPERDADALPQAIVSDDDVHTATGLVRSLRMLSTSDDELRRLAQAYRTYVQATTELARRYLRFEMWSYLRNTSLPLRYGISHASAMRSLDALAESRAGVPARNRSASQEDAKQREVARLQHESLERIELFFGSTLQSEDGQSRAVERELAVFYHYPDSDSDPQRGVTACALASSDGVMASRPERSEEWEDCCYYVEGLPLAIERKKLKNLWLDYTMKGRASRLNGLSYGSGVFEWWKRPAQTSA